MIPQTPKLRKPHFTQIHQITALAHRRLAVRPIRYHRAQGQDEAAEVLVQCEEPEHLPGRLRLGRGGGQRGRGARFLLLAVLVAAVGTHGFGVDLVDLVDVEGDPSLVPPSCPLWVQSSCGLILVDVDRLIEVVEVVVFAPVLCILELLEGFFGDKLAGAEVAQEGLVVVSCCSLIRGRNIVATLFTVGLEFLKLGSLVRVQVADVCGGPLGSRPSFSVCDSGL